MRTARFRDVLWSVAHKAGYSPESGNFISNQAIPIGEYINDWVSRLYTQEDWPEWTKVIQVAPDANHIVPYETTAAGVFSATPYKIGRVITVYLIDPKTTRAPITTRYSLREEGIHCGYEHGTNVWIKYLEPPPTFTAVPWRPEVTYAKNDVVYSGGIGECYKSKSNGNVGHSPTMAFQEPTRIIPVTTEIIQEHVPDNVGVSAQNKSLEISVASVNPGPNPPDPPPQYSDFGVEITDADGVSLASVSSSPDGIMTLADVLTELQTLLIAGLPGTFTVTINSTNKSLIIEDASDFQVYQGGTAYLEPPPNNTVTHLLKVGELQSYMPTFSSAGGQSQKILLTLTSADVATGTTYKLLFTDDFGIEHIVEYTAVSPDGGQQILAGLAEAVETARATDTYFESVAMSVNPTALTLTISTRDAASIDATRRPPPPRGSPWWDLVRFPEALVNPVVRGAGGALKGEWDQTDKQSVDEGKVGAETSASRGDFEPTQTATLTTQQQARSRYKY